MRATRAYVAGIGTAGSLLAGAAMVFVLATALLTFKGWPQASNLDSPAIAVVSGPPVTAGTTRRVAAAVAATAPPPAIAVVSGPSPAGAGPTLIASTRVNVQPTLAPNQKPTPHGGRLPGPPNNPTPPVAKPPATNPVSTVVATTTGTLAGAVTQTGGTLGSTVTNGASGLGSVVSKLNPVLGNVIASAGGTLGSVVTKVTSVLGSVISSLGTKVATPTSPAG